MEEAGGLLGGLDVGTLFAEKGKIRGRRRWQLADDTDTGCSSSELVGLGPSQSPGSTFRGGLRLTAWQL